MNSVEWCVVAIGAVGLAVWIHGCIARSVSTCGLGLAAAAVAGAVYFTFFGLTRIPYLASIVAAAFVLSIPLFTGFIFTAPGKVLAAMSIAFLATTAAVEHHFVSAGNALLVIHPYRSGGTWRFDEPKLRLQGEPFVAGIPEMIDKLVADIPAAEKGFRLIFSSKPFPGGDFRLDLRRREFGGNWYYSKQHDMEGWLCPALFKFFPRAPRHIYAKAEAI